MTPDTISTIQTLLDIGWPAIVTLAAWIMWRRLSSVQDARMQDMKDILTNDLVDIRARLATIEAQLSARATLSEISNNLNKPPQSPN